MITRKIKLAHGEPISMSLVVTQDDCNKCSTDAWAVKSMLPLVHLGVSHAYGDPFLCRKQLRSLIKKLQEIDEMWDVAVAHGS